MRNSASFSAFPSSVVLSDVADIEKVQCAPIPNDGRLIRESPSRY